MMRSPRSFVVVVRRPDGAIAVREQQWRSFLPDVKPLRWPLVRGALVLLESIHNGFVALQFSGEHALPEEDKPQGGASSAAGAAMWIAMLAMVALFIAAPHALAYGIARALAWDPQGMASQAVDGVLRIAILVGYVSLMAQTEQARRLFGYHGAEHKAIWTYESCKTLTVDNARGFPRQHPRCGTSFLFVVIFVAVVVHALLLPRVPRLATSDLLNALALVPLKISLALPIAGLAYELQKLSARERCPPFIRWLTAPGMWLQNLTTREPDDAQLEVALLALERALAREEGRSRAPDGVAVYPDYAVAAAA